MNMIRIRAYLFILMGIAFCSIPARTQLSGIFTDEPTEKELGAPLYPGAVFIRKIPGTDPYYETAMYISFVPMNIVEVFFADKLIEKRAVYYEDKDMYITAYLLKTWSRFPGKPKREDIARLESEPSVQIRFYDPTPNEPLAEYFDKLPESKIRADAVRNGKTLFLYTYEKSETFKNVKQAPGIWKEVSRDLGQYYNCVLEFRADSTYSLTLTPENLSAMARDPQFRHMFPDKTSEDIVPLLRERNPETGRYVIMKNMITLASDNPVDGEKTKSGLVDAGPASLSLELINKQRLTFVRMKLE